MNDFMKNAEGKPAIELGKVYRDNIHKFEGVATIVTRYLAGCDRVCLETMEKSEVKETWFDISRLEKVEIPTSEARPGGPQSSPPPRSTG